VSEIKKRIHGRVIWGNDIELHKKLQELVHFQRESLPKLRRGVDYELEMDPESFTAIMRGQGKAASIRTDELCAELAADISQFGEDEKRVADWLFHHSHEVLDGIQNSQDMRRGFDRNRTLVVLVVLLAIALLGAAASYFLLQRYVTSNLRLLSAGVFILLVLTLLQGWKLLSDARIKKKCRIGRDVRASFKRAQTLIEAGSYGAAKEAAEQGYALAKRTPGAMPWDLYNDVLGQALLGIKQVDEARQCFEHALELARISKYNSAEFAALSGLGKCYLLAGDRAQALTTFKAALEVAQRDNFSEFLERAEHNLALVGSS